MHHSVLGTGYDAGKPGPLSAEKREDRGSEDLCHALCTQCLIVTPDGKKLCYSEEVFLGPSKKSNRKCAVTVLISLCGTEEKSLRTCAAGAWVKSAC